MHSTKRKGVPPRLRRLAARHLPVHKPARPSPGRRASLPRSRSINSWGRGSRAASSGESAVFIRRRRQGNRSSGRACLRRGGAPLPSHSPSGVHTGRAPNAALRQSALRVCHSSRPDAPVKACHGAAVADPTHVVRPVAQVCTAVCTTGAQTPLASRWHLLPLVIRLASRGVPSGRFLGQVRMEEPSHVRDGVLASAPASRSSRSGFRQPTRVPSPPEAPNRASWPRQERRTHPSERQSSES